MSENEQSPSQEAKNEQPRPQESGDKKSALQDTSKFILLVHKYDAQSGQSRSSAAVVAPTTLGTEKLGTIRIFLINAKALDKQHLKTPFCTQDGGEVSDDTPFEDYMVMNDEKKNAERRTVYLKAKKRSTGLDEHTSAFLREKLDLEPKNKPTLSSVEAKALSSTYTHSNWKASAGSGKTVYAADMSENQWAVVLRNTDLLCGHFLTASRKNDNLEFTGIIPRHYPAFAMRKRKIQGYDIPSEAASTIKLNPSEVEFRIPRFRITDKARVEITEIKGSLKASMAESGFSQTSIEASAGGSFCGISAGIKAGYSESKSNGSATSSFKDEEYMYISYDFPRVEIYLEDESLEISPECWSDLEILRTKKTKEELERFYRKYGHVFVPEVQLGGRLYSIENTKSFGTSRKEEMAQMMKAAASASVSGFGFQAEVSASHEKNTASESSKQSSKYNHSITWHADGGDTLLCNNPPSWCSTVSSFYNWRIMKRTQPVELIKLIGKMPNCGDIPHLVEHIDDAQTVFVLEAHIRKEGQRVPCRPGMLVSAGSTLSHRAGYHYNTEFERFPIMNYPPEKRDFESLLVAVGPKKDAIWEADGKTPRMKYGDPYRLHVIHKYGVYGLRQTTKADYFSKEGYLYGGKNEESNIIVRFSSLRGEKQVGEQIGGGDQVIPNFFTENGHALETMRDYADMMWLSTAGEAPESFTFTYR